MMTAVPTSTALDSGSTLAHLPIALFGSVMGLTGLAVAWRLAQVHFGAPSGVAQVVGAGARVEAEAQLDHTVVWPGATAGGRLHEAVVTVRAARSEPAPR